MNLVDAIAWPMRPFAKRILADLGDFAGVTWVHLTIAAGTTAVALDLATTARNLWPISILVAAIMAWAVVSVRQSRRILAQGTAAPLPWYINVYGGGYFWIYVVAYAGFRSLAETAGALAFSLYLAFLIWGGEDGGRGKSVLAKAWDRVKGIRWSSAVPAVES